LGWNKSCIDEKVGAHCTIPWSKWDWSGACVNSDIQLSDKETNLGLAQCKAGVTDTQCCHIYRYTTQICYIKLESA